MPRWNRRRTEMADVKKIATRDSYGNTLKAVSYTHLTLPTKA